MVADETQCRYRLGATGARVLLVALCSSLALMAFAQSIKIPDLRSPPPQIYSMKPGERCDGCGQILSIREVRLDRTSTVPPAFQGGPGSRSGLAQDNLVGAVIYLPLGGDSKERPFVGGVGTPEAQERFRQSTYEILVRFDDTTMRTIRRFDGSRYRVGDRVRVTSNDEMDLIAQ